MKLIGLAAIAAALGSGARAIFPTSPSPRASQGWSNSTHRRNGPGWSHAQVKRMAIKAKNRLRHKVAAAKKGGAK